MDRYNQSIMVSARADIELMKEAIEELKTFEEKARPQKMDVSSVAVPDTPFRSLCSKLKNYTQVCYANTKAPFGIDLQVHHIFMFRLRACCKVSMSS